MRRFIEGEDRTQTVLLPACLDDYIAEADAAAQRVVATMFATA